LGRRIYQEGWIESVGLYVGKRTIAASKRGRNLMTGRVRRSGVPYNDERGLACLAVISSKNDIDPGEFLDGLFKACKEGRSACGALKVECRERVDGYVFILVTAQGRIVAQLRLKEAMLLDEQKTRAIYNRLVVLTYPKREENHPVTNPEIRSLMVGTRVAELRAKVVGKQSTRRVHSRWGNPQLISMAVISDGTASINLPLWNTQIDLVSTGDLIQIKNGKVGVFRGEKQLNISRKLGELSVL